MVGWGTCEITNTQTWTKTGPVGGGITGLPSHQGGINMMSGGIGTLLAAVCMTHRCVGMPTMGQIARWTRLVSLGKAAALGDGYSEIKTKPCSGALRRHPLHIGRPKEG